VEKNGVTLPALKAAAGNPEGSFTSAAAEAARSRAAGAVEEEPACCASTGPGVEKNGVTLPALKAAAGNPEGSFTPAAAEAVMTEAVGPLVTADTGKTRPPACTSRQLAGSTDML
jgi:hypothetical protein